MEKRHWLIRNGLVWLVITLLAVILLAQRASDRIMQMAGGALDKSTDQIIITTPDSLPSKVEEASKSPLPTPTPTPPAEIVWKVAEAVLVENGPYQDMQWSPDGTHLLVSKKYTQYLLVRERGEPIPVPGLDQPLIPGTYAGLGDLWLIDRATGEEKQLLPRVGRYTWSPDGKEVAYLAPVNEEGIEGALYILDIASGKSRRIASVDFFGSDYEPQWLPNGKLIFVRDGQILAQPAAENGKALATGLRFRKSKLHAGDTEYTDPTGTPSRFRFSPDGTRVVYLTKGHTYRAIAYQLWLADADGSNAQMITEQAEGSYYEWSPDGEWLVFNTYRDIDDPVLDTRLPPIRGLWAIRADGTDPRRLYKEEGWAMLVSPAWSFDSQFVAFIDYDPSTETEPSRKKRQDSIKIVNVLTTQPISLINVPPVLDTVPSIWWSADGHDLFALKRLGDLDEYETYRLQLTTGK